MRLHRLSVHNLGVFRGTADFVLTPLHHQDGKRPHLTVFIGHNGAGKSTLFQAFALALYGAQALGSRTSSETYNDFLLSRLHRYVRDGETIISQEGGVTLAFQYIRSGVPLDIEVQRVWQRRGLHVKETLIVFQNDRPPDVPPEDYQIWLRELVPLGIVPLCFFDAEQLNSFADPEEHNGKLDQVLQRLLGLDLVERLIEDLDYYAMRQGSSQRAERVRQNLLEQQAHLDELTRQQNQLQVREEGLAQQEDDSGSKLAVQEQRLAAAGGTYAKRRPQLQDRLVEIQKEMENVSIQLHDLSAELLPFALVPTLCRKLSDHLIQEAELLEHETAQRVLREHINSVESTLKDDAFWEDIEIPSPTREALQERLTRTLRTIQPEILSSLPIIHHLSRLERQQVQQWIAQALHAIPERAQAMGTTLRELRAERKRIEQDLRRAPENEVLAPIHKKILELEAAIRQVQGKRATLSNQISILQFRREEQARICERAHEQLHAVQDQKREIELAERSKAALKTYQDALTRQRLEVLESTLARTFNALCQKEHLVDATRIDPSDFHVQLLHTDHSPLNIGDLSAGERQLYALALLWALRRVSGRQLPVVIDTPLARLDEIHRWRLIHDYVPSVSDQVILFVTGAELDAGLLAQAEPHLARTYYLSYDERQQSTIVQSSDVSPLRDLMLYRTKVPVSSYPGVSSGEDQPWTTDLDRGLPEGKAERALLSATAKRLVLVNPSSGHSEFVHIANLERIVSSTSLIDQVQTGTPIYELWQKEWTSHIREAGYDSVATACREGPVEYVLNPAKLVSSSEAPNHEE